MSFQDFLTQKSKSIVEFKLQEFKDNLLADIANILLLKKEEAEEIFLDSINIEQVRDLCKKTNYPKGLAFEVCLYSKNVVKILEHLQEIENKRISSVSSELDYLKNNLFNYILKLERKNFDSKDIDLILENKIIKAQKMLSNIEAFFNKFNFREIKKITLKPFYESLKNKDFQVEVMINENNDAVFYCKTDTKNLIFKDLLILSQQEKLKKEIENFYEFCQKKI